MPGFWSVVGRSLLGRCPKCGKGNLFARYLKQVDHCEDCGEQFGHIRADDGPAWLTIIVVGHVLAPIWLWVLPGSTWPEWFAMTFWATLSLVMLLVLLPRAKGLFIGLIWRNQAH
jgi:uncharacterized protein (DUF983 family)